MRNLLCIERLAISKRQLTAFCTLSIVAIFLPTSTVVAQTGNTENASERIGGDVILGAYASSRGLISKLPDLCVPYCEPIDPIPYSGFHGSIRYDSYQTVFFFAKDKNEFMFHFTGRYNFHLIEEKLKIQFFPFLGLSIWFFDRKFPIQGKYPIKSESGGYVLHEIKVDRPDGVSVIPGITTGLSIEYDIIYNIIFKHFIECI